MLPLESQVKFVGWFQQHTMLSSSVGGRMKAGLVREISALRKSEFYKTLAMLRAQVNLLIMEAATQSLKSVMIEVPLSYVGREPYDAVDMGKALVEQLQADGYTMTGTFLKFRVSWDREIAARKKTADDSPIIAVPATRKRR